MKDTVWDKIRYFYWAHWSYDWRPGQISYRLKCFLWKRYTTIKPRYLPHTWCDRVALLPHMMFEILSDFVEGEASPGHIEWYGEDGHKITVDGEEKYVRDEIQELYDWWHLEYNVAYPETQALLWDAAQRHDMVKSTREVVDADFDDEDEEWLEEQGWSDREGWTVWEPEWATEEDELLYNVCMDALNRLEHKANVELTVRMHRLVNLMPYLWT